MKRILLLITAFIMLFFFPKLNFGQAPDLGSLTGFAIFTAVGAVNNSGSTIITGDIGTNVGAFNGFPPGTVFGAIHVADPASAQAAIDVEIAYSQLSGVDCGAVLESPIGNNQILTPNVYCLGAASVLNGDITLDAQGNPNAVFIFKVNGAFSTSTFSNVILINSASLCNVYWQIGGQFDLGDYSVFRGCVIVDGAINLLEGSSLFGRGLSRAGAISLNSNVCTVSLPPVASTISAGGPSVFCSGDDVVLTGNVDGVWSTGASTPTITVNTAGDYYVTNSNDCGSVTSNHIILEPVSVGGTVTGGTTVCAGSTSGVLTLVGYTGTVLQWQSSVNGTVWTAIANTTDFYTSEALTETTQFRAIVKSGVCPQDTSGSTTVTVIQLSTPSVGIAITNGTNPSCFSELVTFTATPINGGPNPTYEWFNNNVLVATTASYTFNSSDGDQVYVVMTTSDQCYTGATATSATTTMQVSGATPVSVNIQATRATGGQVKFTAYPVNGGSAPVYTWYKNNQVISGVTGPELISVSETGDEHYVVLTSSLPCTTPATSVAWCTY